MVAHLFAHQAQEEARTYAGNFYFYGNKCNSYGSHYRAAVHHGDCVLINRYRYSTTTASQLTELHRACSHLTVFEVDNPDAETKGQHRENFREMVREYEAELLRVSRARVYNSTDTAERMLKNANAYAVRFKIGNRLQPVAVQDAKAMIEKREAKDRRAAERARKAAEKQRAAELEKAKAEYSEQLKNWRDGLGSNHSLNGYKNVDRARLRLTDDGQIVQTTHGVEFPAHDAAKHIDFVLQCFEAKRNWQRNGEHIPLGYFQLDRIDGENGLLLAGCHTVTVNEVRRLAVLLEERDTA
jgi:hypothetical protein